MFLCCSPAESNQSLEGGHYNYKAVWVKQKIPPVFAARSVHGMTEQLHAGRQREQQTYTAYANMQKKDILSRGEACKVSACLWTHTVV